MRMTLLARPQPGAVEVAAAGSVAAWADCSLSIPPRLMPRKAEPPTRRMSRRVTPRWESHKSLPGWPGMQSIDMAGSFWSLMERQAGVATVVCFATHSHPQFKGGAGRNYPDF